MELYSKMADATTTNTAQHIHMEPLLTSPNQKRWKQNWTATFQPPGCLWFLSWMKELPHSFPEGSEVSLCTACLPARPPQLPHAEWLVLTPSLPATASQSYVIKVLGFVKLFVMLDHTRLGQNLHRTELHEAGHCNCRSCCAELYEQTKYRKWVQPPELRWQQPHSWEEEWGWVKCSVAQTFQLKYRKWLLLTQTSCSVWKAGKLCKGIHES